MAQDVNARFTSVNRRAANELLYKAHSEDGVHFLTGTSAAPSNDYYGFIVLADAAVSAITYIDSTKQTGDITSVTSFPTGMYISIPGGFSTLTLAYGQLILLKYTKNKV